MFGKVFDWLVHRYWAGEYIRKSEIRNILAQARTDEAALQTQHFTHEMDRLRETLTNEQLLMEEGLRSEISRLNTLMSTSVKKVKRADDAYYQSIRALRKNRQLSGDVIEKMRELMGLIGNLLGAFEGIERSITDEIELIEYK